MRLVLSLLVVLTMTIISACGGSENDASDSDGSDVSGAAERTDYPLTIDNCGITHTYHGPPQRAVALNQNVTEIMLALGLEDRMVGTAFVGRPVAERWRDAYESVPKLADQYPSREELLAANPDFVYGGLLGSFGDNPLAGRRQLEDLDIATFQATEYCASNPGSEAEDLTMDVLYDDIETLGRIFDVQDRAARLVSDLKGQIAAVADATEEIKPPVRVARLRLPETGSATTDGRGSVGHLVITLAGGENVFADQPERDADVSWEEVARRDPEVILIAPAVGDGRESIDFLNDFPAVADVEAVRNQRYVTIGFEKVALGVRTVEGIRSLAEDLYPDAFSASDS